MVLGNAQVSGAAPVDPVWGTVPGSQVVRESVAERPRDQPHGPVCLTLALVPVLALALVLLQAIDRVPGIARRRYPAWGEIDLAQVVIVFPTCLPIAGRDSARIVANGFPIDMIS